jgi:hypothetical protein
MSRRRTRTKGRAVLREPVDSPRTFDGYINGRRFVLYGTFGGRFLFDYQLRPGGLTINGWDVPDRFLDRGWMTWDDVPEEQRNG